MLKRWDSKLIFSISFLLFVCITTFVTFTYVNNKMKMERSKMEQVILTQANKVESTITRLLYKTQVLSALVIQNDGKIQDFDQVAAMILDDPSIRNVLMAPNGVVTHVYPLEGNEKAMGLDFFSQSQGNLEAIQARKSGKLVLGGPFELRQGGEALVGRLPVSIEGKFWGLVSVTLSYPQALSGAELEQLRTQGFAFEIWRINPDDNQHQVIATSSYDYNHKAPYIEREMNILNAQWHFRLSPIRNWYEIPDTWIFLFTGIAISWLIAQLLVHNQELQSIKDGLEKISITDSLTGIYNRRGILEQLNRILEQGETSFIVSYVDLDRFKSINDKYGHRVGDRTLCQFTNIVKQHLAPQDLLGRIGGDEFLVVFPGMENPSSVISFWDSVMQDCKGAVPIDKKQNLDILFSFGFSCYPQDGANLDDLLSIADSQMYEHKKKVVSPSL